MKNNVKYVLGAFLLVASLAFVSTAFARNGEDDDKEKNLGQMMKSAIKEIKSEYKEMRKSQKEEAKENGSTLEVHFFDNGKVLVRGAKVTSVAGAVVNATTTWGSVNLNWAVDTTNATSLVRKYGGKSDVSEIAVGDFISFEGALVTTSTSPIGVAAKVLKNWSVQKKNANFEGTVKSVDSANSKFVLTTQNKGDITVMTSGTTVFKKGSNTGVFADVVVGAKVMARGILNTQLMQLSADEVRVIVDTTPAPTPSTTTITGVIKSIASTTLPTTMVVTVGTTDYTVTLGATTSILNNVWSAVGLNTYVVGNTVNVYGLVNHTTFTATATVVKNSSM